MAGSYRKDIKDRRVSKSERNLVGARWGYKAILDVITTAIRYKLQYYSC